MKKRTGILILILLISLISGNFLAMDIKYSLITQNRQENSDSFYITVENHPLLWNTTWGGSGSENCFAIALETKGYLYLAGYTSSFGAGGYESANRLELGGTETIIISGVDDLSGIQTVLLAFEGSNHTMTSLGGKVWYYANWTLGTIGTYYYQIYMQDNLGHWNKTNGSIQVFTTPTAPPNQDWLTWLLAILLIGTVFVTIFNHRRLTKKIQRQSSPKITPPKDLSKRTEN